MSDAPRGERSLSRKVADVLRYPLSMVEGKHSRRRSLSAFRVMLIGSWGMFAWHWPAAWGAWEWATLTTLVLAPVVADLFAAVPGKEALQALTAIFGGVVGKRTTHTEMTTTDVGPQPPAPPDGAVG